MEVERIRRDNRAFDQIRPVSVKLGVLENADGSADFSQGHTRVIASVHGPVAAKSRYEQIDRATIKVTVESYNSAPSTTELRL